jgi:hypothetical protein
MTVSHPVHKILRGLFLLAATVSLASLAVASSRVYRTLAAPLNASYAPSTLGFEGWLADSAGQPLTDQHSLTFRLYSQATAGSALWTETYSNYMIRDGLYSVQLGSITALPAAAFDGDRWVGVTVDGDPEMTPRIPVGSVPFARNARQATGIQGIGVAPTAPQDKQALVYKTSPNQWQPQYLHSSVRVTSTAALAIFQNTYTALEFNTVSWDGEDYFNSAANTRLTAPRSGTYLIVGNWQMQQANNFGVHDIEIRLNGSTIIAYSRLVKVQGTNDSALSISTVYSLNAGEYAELIAFHNTTLTSIDTVVVPNYSPEFEMAWLGP